MEQENPAVIQFGRRNLQAPHHWELLDFDDFKLNRPAVFCLPGNGATTNKGANGFAKQAERYLDLLLKTKFSNPLDTVDIISVKYAFTGEIANIGALDDTACEQIALAILNLLVDSNSNKLNLDQAKKNMARVTFFTYCAGNQELQNIIEKLNEKLALVGYNQKEIAAINQATLEVSFAPLSVGYNKIPSVRVISLQDKLMRTFLNGKLNKLIGGELANFNGIYLHEDNAGSLYGEPCEKAPAGSIQVISSQLINSYSENLDEHSVDFTARDETWNLRGNEINGVSHRADNADCVSQIMAWTLSKAVENSIQNFQAEQYVPNTYWGELKNDFSSIIRSFTPERLAKNPIPERRRRKAKFDHARFQKDYKHNCAQWEMQECQKKLGLPIDANTKLTHTPTFETMVDTINNANNLEEVIAYLKQNEFLGIEYILPEIQVLTQAEKDAILKMAGNTAAPQTPTTDYTK